jgi:hypothetical protein
MHAPPGDDDPGPFRPLEALRHAMPVDDDLEVLACAYVTDPVREGRAFDTITTKFPVVIHRIGAEPANASRHGRLVFVRRAMATGIGCKFLDIGVGQDFYHVHVGGEDEKTTGRGAISGQISAVWIELLDSVNYDDRLRDNYDVTNGLPNCRAPRAAPIPCARCPRPGSATAL